MKYENTIQSQCFQWAWNTLPETRRLLAYNLNNSKNALDGARNKALGLIAGRADMEFLWNGKLYYFEFKTDKGKQSQEQVKYQQLVEKHGAKYYIVKSLDEFIPLITRITQSETSKPTDA